MTPYYASLNKGLRGNGPALAGKLWGRIGFCAARRVFVDRFQCLLRTDPAAALVGWMSEEKLVGLRGIHAAGAGVGV